MRIAGIKILPVTIPRLKELKVAYATRTVYQGFLVQLVTDSGLTGLGEAYWGAGVAELVHRAGSLIVGEDPVNTAKLMFLMERCLSGEGAQAGGEAKLTVEQNTPLPLETLESGKRNEIAFQVAREAGTRAVYTLTK